METPDELVGQWIGLISGTNSGYMMLNVDRDRSTRASIQVNDPHQPFSAECDISVTGTTVNGKLSRFTPHGNPSASGGYLPQEGRFSGNVAGDHLTGTWETDIKTSGAFEIQRESLKSRDPHRFMRWQEFRTWALEEPQQKSTLIFRGHDSSQYSLVTSFHRTVRRNLLRYDAEDLPRLCRLMEAVLNTTFNIRDPLDYGCLLNLAQHHGFPTPLLDWTESPFVAAFFAFSTVRRRAVADDSYVRIFLFDPDQWPFGTVATIADTQPSFARLNLRARNNSRVLPQQSVLMFSNIVDIENFIEVTEGTQKCRFLTRIDIPTSERSLAMRELDTMGVTAASLFPGIDGLCRSLAEKWF